MQLLASLVTILVVLLPLTQAVAISIASASEELKWVSQKWVVTKKLPVATRTPPIFTEALVITNATGNHVAYGEAGSLESGLLHAELHGGENYQDIERRQSDAFFEIFVKLGTFSFTSTLTLGSIVSIGAIGLGVYGAVKTIDYLTSSHEVDANSRRSTEKVHFDLKYNSQAALDAEQEDVNQYQGKAEQGAITSFAQMVHDNHAAGGCGTFTYGEHARQQRVPTAQFGIVEEGTHMTCAGAT